MKEHQWSGWPGAYCLDCHAEDQAEVCIAVHDRLDFICAKCSEHWPQGPCPTGGLHDTREIPCWEHQNGPCPA